MDKIFFAGVFIILVLFSLLAWLLSGILDFDLLKIKSLMFSGILSTINIVVAYFIVRYSFKKNADTFNKAFLVSMGGRFVALLAVIFLILKFAEVHRLSFLISLFLLYFTFQFLEVIVINKYLNKGKSE